MFLFFGLSIYSIKQMKMKKLVTLLGVCFVLSATAAAQKQSLGLRLGGGTYFNAEACYQKDLSDAHRLELDLGLEGAGAALTGMYQWVWDLSDLSDNFSWYAGIGGGVHLFEGFGLGLNGQVGIEYTIPDVPLKFSLDARPGWYIGNADGFGYGAALGIHYVF